MMIAHTEETLEVGVKYRGWIAGVDGKFHNALFVVLAPATYQDYIKYCKQEEVTTPVKETETWNYYKISTD